MAAPGMRYYQRRTIRNAAPQYSNILDARGRFGITHYTTPQLTKFNYIELEKLEKIHHIWTTGDRFYKLAYEYYENTTIWWVIAHLNQKPTESHCVIGEEIAIYLPLKDVLLSLGIF